MLFSTCLALFSPLVGFLLLLCFAYRLKRLHAVVIACSTLFISFACFVGLFIAYTQQHSPLTFTLFNWLPIEGINATFSLRLDPLSLLMTLIISGIGLLIHIYSAGYMDHEKNFCRYFSFLNFFVFAMLLLVLAGDILLLFVGWEGVGLASYLLIGFWYEKPAAAKAATKAFIVNRVGDCGLLLGLLLTFQIFATSDIAAINDRASATFTTNAPLLVLLTLLYFVGATGKSAQLPLHTWLADAMEGPTPVSALIHAATMVTAGVYLVVRMHSLFILAPLSLHVIGAIGATTSLFAAFSALGQTDLKRVLAYSTVSQLGLMFLACGIGAFYAAMFHLTTHAFMKALLFLSAGNVVHMMHGTTEMGKMGGLLHKFHATHLLFFIGVLAMSGVPPLAAFFSKDLILEQEHLAGFDTLFYIGLLTSILTAFYLTRAYCLTFTGLPKDGEKFEKAHEAPSVMLIPCVILALLALFGGILGLPFGKTSLLEGFLAEIGITLPQQEAFADFLFSKETFLSIGGAFLGIFSAAIAYTRFVYRLPANFLFLRKAFFIDEIYEATLAFPLRFLGRLINKVAEPKLFDNSIHALAKATGKTAFVLQHLQSGQIRSYVAWMAIGSLFLIVYFIAARGPL